MLLALPQQETAYHLTRFGFMASDVHAARGLLCDVNAGKPVRGLRLLVVWSYIAAPPVGSNKVREKVEVIYIDMIDWPMDSP